MNSILNEQQERAGGAKTGGAKTGGAENGGAEMGGAKMFLLSWEG